MQRNIFGQKGPKMIAICICGSYGIFVKLLPYVTNVLSSYVDANQDIHENITNEDSYI